MPPWRPGSTSRRRASESSTTAASTRARSTASVLVPDDSEASMVGRAGRRNRARDCRRRRVRVDHGAQPDRRRAGRAGNRLHARVRGWARDSSVDPKDVPVTASPEAIASAIAAAEAASDKLAEDIVAIDVSEKLVITDVFLLCSAANERQVKAVVDGVEERLHKMGVEAASARGRGRGPVGPAGLRRHRRARPAGRGAHPLRDRAAVEGLPVHRAARMPCTRLVGAPRSPTRRCATRRAFEGARTTGSEALRTGARSIVLWRHGRTPWNAEQRFQGQTDIAARRDRRAPRPPGRPRPSPAWHRA